MSADNGIYIAKFPDGYRVAYASCIENIDWFEEGSKERKEELERYFGESKIFQTIDEANIEAARLEKEIRDDDFFFLEYGINYVGEYEQF